MSGKHKQLDTSDELHLFRVGNGVKLVSPHEVAKYNTSQLARDTGHTVGSLSRLPLSFYFLNTASATERINNEGIEVCGFQSSNNSIGKSLFDVSKHESAANLIENCNKVMADNEVKIFEEVNLRNDGQAQQFLSIKSPWYDQKDKLVGICGFSIVLGKHPLAHSLSTIQHLGLLNYDKQLLQQNNTAGNDVHLSRRERECLRLTGKGYTAKNIGRALKLSHRTVEEYLGNIKVKFGVKSKSELIEIAVNYFAHGI